MRKYALVLLLCSALSPALADHIMSEPTGNPGLDTALIIGVVAVAALLIVRRIRRRKKR